MATGHSAGFWSYVQADDEAVGGAILQLAQWISAEYEMLTATPLELFVDRQDVQWGDEWQLRIDQAIAGTTFFIPIVTPRYFESDACRRELVRFTGTARSHGLGELLLPVHYVDVPALADDSPADDAVRLIKDTQWVDWRELRLSDPTGSDFRRGVNDMARRLAQITERVTAIPDRSPARVDDEPEGQPDGDATPGLVDLLAEGEAALPVMTDSIEAIGNEIVQIGSIMNAATGKVEAADSRYGSFAARLVIAREVASELDPHADRIQELGRKYGTALVEADPGVQAMLVGMEDEMFATPELVDPDDRATALDYVRSVQDLANGMREGIKSLRDFLEILEGLSRLSRDMRRPASRMKAGLQGLVDGQAVIDEWARRASRLEGRIRDAEPEGLSLPTSAD
jgi:TIR domain